MNYESAYTKALERFQELTIEEISSSSGYAIVTGGISVKFLGQEFVVSHPEGRFEPSPPSSSELPIFTQILILHYLVNANLPHETGNLISYKELPGGTIYIAPFTNRAINPLVRAFGDKGDLLLKTAKFLGGEIGTLGDFSVKIYVFPLIPVTLVLWEGDEEFPASGNILFDSSAPSILPTEDYAVLASILVHNLIQVSKTIV